jgi:hypothetical protein
MFIRVVQLFVFYHHHHHSNQETSRLQLYPERVAKGYHAAVRGPCLIRRIGVTLLGLPILTFCLLHGYSLAYERALELAAWELEYLHSILNQEYKQYNYSPVGDYILLVLDAALLYGLSSPDESVVSMAFKVMQAVLLLFGLLLVLMPTRIMKIMYDIHTLTPAEPILLRFLGYLFLGTFARLVLIDFGLDPLRALGYNYAALAGALFLTVMSRNKGLFQARHFFMADMIAGLSYLMLRNVAEEEKV